MLGLKQFSAPQFYVPQIPQTERPLHKAKDLMSFLNSLQWKADEDVKDVKDAKDDEDVVYEDPDLRRGAEAALLGLNASLHSGHDITQPIGTTRWDGMNDSQLWEQAMNSIVTGENPITEDYGDKIGMTSIDVSYPKKSRFVGWTPEELKEYVFSPLPTLGGK